MDTTIDVSLKDETKVELPVVDYKKGSGFPTRRAMLLQF